jgi:hypothetical protein
VRCDPRVNWVENAVLTCGWRAFFLGDHVVRVLTCACFGHWYISYYCVHNGDAPTENYWLIIWQFWQLRPYFLPAHVM